MSAGRDEPAKNEAEQDAAAERPLLQEWARIGEDYVARRLIGRGGQSQIYEGYDTRNERLVAIKVFLFKHQLNAAMLKRAKAEAKAEMRIVHPNIVKVHAAGVTDIQGPDGRKRELFYSVMEFLEGETLEDRIHRKGRLDVAETLAILAEAADGLAMLHRARIIHRDIKPENIFLAKAAAGAGDNRDGDGDGNDDVRALRVVLIDLGIAKLDPQQFSVQRTDSNILLGTFAYMSPEQIHHKCPVDGRADLYSLGIVAFKCLTGVHPAWNHYRQPNPPPAEEYAAWHMTVEAPLVSTLRVDVPAGVTGLVARLLAKTPDERYRDGATAAIAAAADLREQLALVEAMPKAVPEVPMNRRVLAAAMVGTFDRWGPFGQATTQEDEGNDGPTAAKDVPVRLREAAITPPEGVAAVRPEVVTAPAMVPPARGPVRTSAGTEVLEATAVRGQQESTRPPMPSGVEAGDVARTQTGTEIVPRQRLASLGLEATPLDRSSMANGAGLAADTREPVTRAPELAGARVAAVPFREATKAAASRSGDPQGAGESASRTAKPEEAQRTSGNGPGGAPMREARTTSGHLMSVPPAGPRATSRRLAWVLSAVAGMLCGVVVLGIATRRGGSSAAGNEPPIVVPLPDLDAGAADGAASNDDASAEPPVDASADVADGGVAGDGGAASGGGAASDAGPGNGAGSRPPSAGGGGAPVGQRVCDFVRKGCASAAECAEDPNHPRCNRSAASPAQKAYLLGLAEPTAAPKATATTTATATTATAATATATTPPNHKLPTNLAPQPLPPKNDRIQD